MKLYRVKIRAILLYVTCLACWLLPWLLLTSTYDALCHARRYSLIEGKFSYLYDNTCLKRILSTLLIKELCAVV